MGFTEFLWQSFLKLFCIRTTRHHKPDQRIGELLRELPTKQGKRTDLTSVDTPTKVEAEKQANIDHHTAIDLQTMASNPEIVEQVIAKAENAPAGLRRHSFHGRLAHLWAISRIARIDSLESTSAARLEMLAEGIRCQMAIEAAKAKERQTLGVKNPQGGKTREKVAEALGVSDKTIRQEQFIENNRDLLDASDFAEWRLLEWPENLVLSGHFALVGPFVGLFVGPMA